MPDASALPKDDRSGGDDADDYRHRMTMNLAALAVVALLIAGGLWLAKGMADLRAAHECLAMSARGACAAIRVPDRDR